MQKTVLTEFIELSLDLEYKKKKSLSENSIWGFLSNFKYHIRA